MMIILFFSIVGILANDVFSQDPEGPSIKIKNSEIFGTYKTSFGGRKYSAFEGVPYAKSPVGNLRFKDPQPLEEWPTPGKFYANRTYICMSFLPLPIIYGVKGTEDCLYVYVYVPKEKIEGNESMDVVIHIHGGAFMMGAPKYVAGQDYIMDRDVVYVSLNYRLGILGFLSTEDDIVPGNMGLKDQSMALKWIKDNIKYFGGNPDSITLTGLSAGGSSVHYHYLSPMSKGLFTRGFSQSGTSLNPWALTENPLQKAQQLASAVDCPTNDSKAMVDCLKEKDSADLIMGIKSLLTYMDIFPVTLFGPVVEKSGSNKFIDDYPYRILEKGEIYDVPWILTHTIEEGLFPAGHFHDTIDENQKVEIVQKVREHFYKNNEDISVDNIYELVKIFTDRYYHIDSEKALRSHSKRVKSPVYFYLFSYVLEMPSLFKGIRKGVAHGDDSRLWLKIFGNPRNFKSDDLKMQAILLDMVTEYAKNGNPITKGVEWKPVDPSSTEIDYLHIGGPDDISMKKIQELSENVKFWSDLPIHENEKI